MAAPIGPIIGPPRPRPPFPEPLPIPFPRPPWPPLPFPPDPIPPEPDPSGQARSSWPLDYIPFFGNDLKDLYNGGTGGTWRNSASYALEYEILRILTGVDVSGY